MSLFPSQQEEDAFQLWAESLLPYEEHTYLNSVAPLLSIYDFPAESQSDLMEQYDLPATDDESSN